MAYAIQIVRKFFPDVKKVKDAKESLTVEVTKQDNKSAAVRNHKGCAMAVACQRAEKADGVIISVGTAYVIKGDTATRFKVPEHTSREVITFDRDAGFTPGNYSLVAPSPASRLGGSRSAGSHKSNGDGKKVVKLKHTVGIRTVLGSGLQ